MNPLNHVQFFYVMVLFLSGTNFISAQEDSAKIIGILDKGYELETENPKQAIATYRSAFQKSLKSNYYKGAFNSLHYIGIVHSDLGNYDSAVHYYKKAWPYSKKAKYKRGEAMTFTNLGNVYQFQGNYDKSIENYLSGIKIFEQIKDSAAATLGFHNLSALYDNTQNSKLELKYLNSALQYVGLNHFEKSLIYTDLGKYYFKQNQKDSALYYLKLAEEFANISGEEKPKYFYNKNMGELFRSQNEHQKAIVHYQKALQLTESFQDSYQKNDILLMLSKAFFAIGNLNESENFANQSLDLAKQINSKDFLYNSYKQLSKIYFRQNQPELAYEFLEKSIVYKDSIINEENLKTISLLQTQFETEKKDNQIASQKIQIKENELKILRKRNQFLFVLGGLILFVIAGFWIYFFQKQKRKIIEKELIQEQEILQLESLMQGQEKERKRIAQELHDGLNGDLSAIKFRVSGLEEYGIKPSEKKHLHKIIDMIDQACTQVRRISHDLMPASIEDFGLVESLNQYCEKLNFAHEIQIDFQSFGIYKPLSKNNESTLYRIIQELLNNTVKHAEATQALVQINFHEEEISISVEDDGKGFDINSTHEGIGLKNVRSRAKSIQGELDVKSSEKGTFVHILIDLNKLKND